MKKIISYLLHYPLIAYPLRLAITLVYSRKWFSQRTFSAIYKTNIWDSQESVSGKGSELRSTSVIREQLPIIIANYNIQSMLDVPCGDYNWMKTVQKSCIYIGGDIVAELIEKNLKLYSSDKVQFMQIDITKDTLPKVDLIFCRDCLQHLSYKKVAEALSNFKNSGSKYLLVTSYPKTWINYDINDGRYRALNLQKSPFRLPSPLLKIKEVKYSEPDKTMLLYDLEHILNDALNF
jgi:SAM-dependent methyltransferase